MKVGIVCHPVVGGSGAVAAEIAKALCRRGHEVHVIAYRAPFRLGAFHDQLTLHEVDAMPYSVFEHPPRELALASKLAEVAREHELDVFHVHYAMPFAVCAYLARQLLGEASPRLVTTLHGTDITLVGQDRSFFELTRFALEHSDAVTCVSEFLRRETITELAIQRDIEVIPNFIDVAELESGGAGAPVVRVEPGERVLLHISNFRPVKRPLDVVRIFEHVLKRIPSAVLWMVGEGPERSAAEVLSRRLGVRARVRFLGVKDSIVEIARLADIFLLPSELEGFGLSALEAMACGVPVIATDAGGLPEVVVDGETGFLAPVGAVEQMAARAIQLLSDEELRRSMGKRGEQRVRSRFDAATVIPMYERTLARVLANG